MKETKNKIFNFSILITTIVLVAAITLQLRTMKENSSEVSLTFASDKLKDSLLSWKENYERSEKLLEESNNQLAEARKTAASRSEEAENMEKELQKNNMLLGLTDVKGDGLTIKVEDSKVTLTSDDLSMYLVHDSDLREIVNELANAGAEAIEINGERIIATTCITCAGNIISVNGKRISSPFIIKAIGNQETLYGAITRPGGYVQLMKNQTIPTEVKKASNITIKKFSGAIQNQYAKTLGE